MNLKKYAGQMMVYGLFMALLGVFSNSPAYQHLPDDMATIKLSLRHTGQLLGECRERSSEEMMNLPASARAPLICPRERSPLRFELDLDGRNVYSEELPPRGLHGDGRVSVYRRLTVPASTITFDVRLKDDIRSETFQHRQSRTVSLEPGQVLVIDFDERVGRFAFL